MGGPQPVRRPTASPAAAWSAGAAELLPEPELPHKTSSNLFLADGTVVGRALTRFGDTADSFTQA